MADVKWIKLTTDMFDNRKIKQIRHLPEGNSIVLIWVMLLTIAGRCNASGLIFLTENIPYTLESLAVELDFEQTVVKLALDVLQKFGMIVCNEEAFYISNWEEYQNVDGMERTKMLNRERQKRWYDKQKELPNVSPNANLTQPNATDIDKDIDKDIKNKNNTPPKSPSRGKGVFVKPSVDEVKAYCEERNNGIDAEAFIDFYESKGWKIGKDSMKDWKAAVRNWERSKKERAGNSKSVSGKNSGYSGTDAAKPDTWQYDA